MAYNYHKSASQRTNKNNARKIAVDSDGLTVCRVPLFITVPGVPDIKEALRGGLINSRNPIIAVNHCRDEKTSPYKPEMAAQIKKDLDNLGLRYTLVDKLFESTRGLRKIADAVEKYGKIDYAFLDLCGLATPSFCSAINKFQDLLAPQARIALTVCTRVRRPQLIVQWQNAFQGELDSPALQILSTSISNEWIGELFEAPKGTRADREVKAKKIRHTKNFLWQVQAVMASFDNYVTQVQAATQYCDLTSMGLVVFDVSRQKNGNQLFHYIAEMCKDTTGQSLTPGQKAWITRRKNLHLTKESVKCQPG